MKKTVRKIAYFLLSLTVAAAMLFGTTTTAFAAETPILEVHINITVPLSGQTDATVVYTETSDEYDITLREPDWEDAGGNPIEGFVSDWLCSTPIFTVEPKTGYCITSETVVYVNGSVEGVNLLGGSETPAQYFDYFTYPEILGEINFVEISNIPTANIGEAPVPYTYTNAAEHYTVESVWKKYDYANIEYADLGSTEVIVSGNIYRNDVTITPEVGYTIGYNTQISVDGENVWPDVYGNVAHLYYDYNFAEELDSIRVKESDIPKAEIGKTFKDETITIPTNNKNVIAEGNWYTFDEDYGHIYEGTFEDGKEYHFYMSFRPKEGYALKKGFYSIIVGDDEMYVSNYNYADHEIRTSFLDVVSEVKIKDKFDIKVGDTLESGKFEIAVPDDADYSATGEWYVYDAQSDSTYPIGQYTKVEDGKLYSLEIYALPADGCEFSEPVYVILDGVKYRADSSNYDYLMFSRKFSFRKSIDKVEVTGYKEAKKGDTASTDGVKVPAGANYVIEAAEWIDFDTGEPATKFEKGKRYIFWASVVAKDGYEFANDAIITLNGEEIENDNSYDTTRVTINKEVSFKEVIKELRVDNLPTFKVGETASFDIKLPKGAKYGADVFWSVWTDGVGYEEFNGTFESGKSYRLEVYFFTEDGYELSAKETKCFIDGKETEEIDVYGWNACLYRSFSEGLKTIDRIELTIGKPEVGAHTSVTPEITLPEDANYSIDAEYVYWLKGNSEKYNSIYDEILKTDANYGVSIRGITADEGYVFSDDIVIVINGKVVTKAALDDSDMLSAKELELVYFYNMECEHLFADKDSVKCELCGYEVPVEKEESESEKKDEEKAPEKIPEKIPPTGDSTLPLCVAVVVALCSVLYLSKKQNQNT